MENIILSQRVNNMAESATLKMTQLSRELKAQGIDVISLSIGEPDFNTPVAAKQAGIDAINNNDTHYPPVPGTPALRKAIAEKLKRDNGLDYTDADIIVSNGAKQAITNVFMAIVDKGDEVIIPAPFWVSYPEMVKLADGTPVFINTTAEQNFKITAEQLEAAITPKTKAFIFSTPCNPSGSVYTKAELAALAEVFKKYPNIIILSDEIYEFIQYEQKHESMGQFTELKDRLVIINGVAKGYAMTGWRIGFLAGPDWIVKACNKLQGQYTSGPCSVSQVAATEAFAGPQDCVEEMRQAFERRKNLIVELTKQIPGLEVNNPTGAFYLFPKCSSYFGKTDGTHVINNSMDLAMYLLEVGHVATVGGDAFGSPECFRMSYATSDENIVEAIRRIKEALAKLK